jgi:hypothetical protein
MNKDLKEKLDRLVKVLAEQDGQTPKDEGDDPIAQELADLLGDIREIPDPDSSDGRPWWDSTFGSVIILLGSTAFWQLVKYLRKNGWTLRRIAELFMRTKTRCPQGSTDPCCVALKRITDVLHDWSNGHDGDIAGLMDKISEISSVLAAIASCSWMRDTLLAVLQAYLRVYLVNVLGMTEEQAAQLIKKLLEWILSGADPNRRPVLVPGGGTSSPGTEECEPNRNKIEQGLWERYGSSVRDFAWGATVIIAIVGIIAAVAIACGASGGAGCALIPKAVAAIIALFATVGVAMGEEEARDLIEDLSSESCASTGTEPVKSSDNNLRLLREALGKRKESK